MKKVIFLLIPFAFFLFGCSSSEVTEEYEGDQREVTYETKESQPPVSETKQQTQQTEVTQESTVTVQTQPEYIPQGPPNPPPPPVKVSLEVGTETSKVETPPTEVTTSELYQYKVQVFAFKSRLNAETEAQKIRNRMPDQKVYVEYQDNLYKVRLGIYSKWEHAKGIKEALFNLGYTDSFIVTEKRQ